MNSRDPDAFRETFTLGSSTRFLLPRQIFLSLFNNIFSFFQDARRTSTMTVPRSLTEAQKNAIAGGNDSQESQAILDAYKAEFGVETVCRPMSQDAKRHWGGVLITSHRVA